MSNNKHTTGPLPTTRYTTSNRSFILCSVRSLLVLTIFLTGCSELLWLSEVVNPPKKRNPDFASTNETQPPTEKVQPTNPLSQTKAGKKQDHEDEIKEIMDRANKVSETLRKLDPDDYSESEQEEPSPPMKAIQLARRALQEAREKKVDAARETMREAEKLADDLLYMKNAEVNAVLQEKEVLAEASEKCQGKEKLPNCRKLCTEGNQAVCLVLADFTATGSWGLKQDFRVAATLAQKICEAKLATACVLKRKFNKLEKEREQKIGELWSEVARFGDDIARGRYLAAFAQKHSPIRSRRGVANINAHMKMITKDQFCPAKKAFLVASSTSDYQKRASAHCTEEPPVGTGVGGVEVPLKTECLAALSLPCP